MSSQVAGDLVRCYVSIIMSIFLRFNVSSQVSVTGFQTNFATMLSSGGDVHFQVYPGRLYNIALYQLDGTLLGYVRVDVPPVLPIGVVRPGDGGDGGDSRGGDGGASGGFRPVPGGSSVTVSGSARVDGASTVQTRLASIADLLSNLPGSRNNPIIIEDGSMSLSSVSASVADCSCSMDGAQSDIDMFIA